MQLTLQEIFRLIFCWNLNPVPHMHNCCTHAYILNIWQSTFTSTENSNFDVCVNQSQINNQPENPEPVMHKPFAQALTRFRSHVCIYTYTLNCSDEKEKRSLQRNIQNKSKLLRKIEKELRKLEKAQKKKTQMAARSTPTHLHQQADLSYSSLRKVSTNCSQYTQLNGTSKSVYILRLHSLSINIKFV